MASRIGRPDLLFLDEPTTGFDQEARRDFWALIESLKAEGVTILLTTDDLDEAIGPGQAGHLDRRLVVNGQSLSDRTEVTVGPVRRSAGPR